MGNIAGVIITPLKILTDERGNVMHMLRSDAPYFEKFGEVYFSTVNPGVTKGWKLHSKSVSNLAAPVGHVKFVLSDQREDSPTKGQVHAVELGSDCYQLLIIPPGVAYAWQNAGATAAIIANCASEAWTAGESQNLPLESIIYDWS